MLKQFFTPTVIVEIGIALAWMTILCLASRHYSKDLNGKSRKMKADYLKTPTSTALTVLGLLLPVLVALTSYLYVSRPDMNYGSLLATIILYFIVLLVAIWETFAILKKANEGDILELNYPADRRFVTALGLMYGVLLLGLFYFAYFFLFEIRPPAQSSATAVSNGTTQFVARPNLTMDMTAEDVHRAWGAPVRRRNGLEEYDGLNMTFELAYDASGKTRTITMRRR